MIALIHVVHKHGCIIFPPDTIPLNFSTAENGVCLVSFAAAMFLIEMHLNASCIVPHSL